MFGRKIHKIHIFYVNRLTDLNKWINRSTDLARRLIVFFIIIKDNAL
jgi:hypothetical protein